MATITLDTHTYQELETFAKRNGMNVSEVVNASIHSFLDKLNSVKPRTISQRYELPGHLKKMRGVLSGIEDKNDDRLNYLLEK